MLAGTLSARGLPAGAHDRGEGVGCLTNRFPRMLWAAKKKKKCTWACFFPSVTFLRDKEADIMNGDMNFVTCGKRLMSRALGNQCIH